MMDKTEEIFLGRSRQLEDFSRLLFRFLEGPEPERPQVVLISGQGGIGKSTLLRKMLQAAEESYADRFQLLHVDWQQQKQRNPAAFAVDPSQLDARHVFRALDNEAAGKLTPWSKSYTQARERITKATQAATQMASRLRDPMEDQRSDSGGKLVEGGAETLGKGVAAGMELAGLGTVGKIVEPLAKALGRFGLNLTPQVLGSLGKKLQRTDLDLLLDADAHLAQGLSLAFQKAAHKKPIVIALDTYEIVDELDALTRLVIQASGPRILWLIAGRRDLYETQMATPRGRIDGYREEDRHAHDVLRLDLRALAREEIREFFRLAAEERRELEDEEVLQMDQATAAIPLAIQLAAEIWRETGDLGAIRSEERVTAEAIVGNMVGRYQQHCVLEEDIHTLAALAMADGDPEVLEAMLLPDLGDEDAYRKHLARVRHRYAAVQRGSEREPRLHDEPAYFYLERYREKTQRQQGWVQELHQRAIEFLVARINRLVGYHVSLEALCHDEDYVSDAIKMARHLFWLDPDRAWPWVTTRYIEGLAHSSTLQEGLADTASTWKVHLSHRGQQRLQVFLAARHGPWTLHTQESVALRKLFEEDEQRGWLADGEIDNRYEEERRAIRRWDLARGLLNQRLLHEGVEVLRDATSIKSQLGNQMAETSLRLAYQLSLDHDYQACRTACEVAATSAPTNARVWRELGSSHALLEDHPQAIRFYRKALEIDPMDAWAWSKLGDVYKDLGELGQAIESHKKALDIEPKSARTWTCLGIDYSLLEDHENSLKSHRKALQIDIEFAPAWREMGLCHQWRQDYGKAIECHLKAIDLEPKDAHSWTALGTDYFWLGDFAQAIDSYKAALRIDPKKPLATTLLAIGLLSVGDFNQAIKILRRLSEAGSKHLNAWSWFGRCQAILGSSEKATKAFRHAVSTHHSHVARALTYWGDLYYRQGEYREARRKYEDAIAEDPGGGTALLSLVGTQRILLDPNEIGLTEGEISTLEQDRYRNLDALEAQWLALQGQADSALEKLAEAIEKVPLVSVTARFYPTFHALRDDPRFIEMTEDAPGATWKDFPDSDSDQPTAKTT